MRELHSVPGQDLHGEPFSHGWGLDLPGYGASLRLTSLQAHTLKPASARHSDGHQEVRGDRIVFTQVQASPHYTASALTLTSGIKALKY